MAEDRRSSLWMQILLVLCLLAPLAILVPLPHAFWDTAGIYCPYL